MPDENSQFAKDEVSAAFDRMSSYYADERGQSPWFQAQVKILLAMLDSEPGLILDVGCAAGAEFEPLLARGFQIVGFDYSPEMLRLAQQRFGASHGIHLLRADAEALPFPDASFDHVVCLGVFEYLSTYDRCMEEIHRVLRPGGVAIISLPTRISLNRFSNYLCNITAVPFWRAIKRLMGKRTSTQPVGQRWNRCIPWQFRAQLRKHGLNPEHSAFSGFLLFPLAHFWPAAELRLFSLMERFSKSRILGWTLSQYLVSARKTGAG
ncbi:MAG: class I SAM-dependent methyltransferase [Candidatus Angelobacter sp.]